MLGVLFETGPISYVILVEYRRVIGRRRPLVAVGETLQSFSELLVAEEEEQEVEILVVSFG